MVQAFLACKLEFGNTAGHILLIYFKGKQSRKKTKPFCLKPTKPVLISYSISFHDLSHFFHVKERNVENSLILEYTVSGECCMDNILLTLLTMFLLAAVVQLNCKLYNATTASMHKLLFKQFASSQPTAE